MNLFPLKLRVLELLMPRFDIITMISALTTRRKHPLCRYTARALGCKWAFYSPCQGEKFTRRHSFCAFRDLFCSRRDCRTKCVCVLNKCSFFPGCIPESTYSQALKKKKQPVCVTPISNCLGKQLAVKKKLVKLVGLKGLRLDSRRKIRTKKTKCRYWKSTFSELETVPPWSGRRKYTVQDMRD